LRAALPAPVENGAGKSACRKLGRDFSVLFDELGLPVENRAEAARLYARRGIPAADAEAFAVAARDEARPQGRTPKIPSADLRQNRPELHGKAHVTRDAQLALHEGRGRVELAFREFLEGVEADADGTIGRLAGAFGDRVRRGFAIDEDAAGLAEIDLDGAAETGILAHAGLHLVDHLFDLFGAHGGSPHGLAGFDMSMSARGLTTG